jgi:hypothetical protein
MRQSIVTSSYAYMRFATHKLNIRMVKLLKSLTAILFFSCSLPTQALHLWWQQSAVAGGGTSCSEALVCRRCTCSCCTMILWSSSTTPTSTGPTSPRRLHPALHGVRRRVQHIPPTLRLHRHLVLLRHHRTWRHAHLDRRRYNTTTMSSFLRQMVPTLQPSHCTSWPRPGTSRRTIGTLSSIWTSMTTHFRLAKNHVLLL